MSPWVAITTSSNRSRAPLASRSSAPLASRRTPAILTPLRTSPVKAADSFST